MRPAMRTRKSIRDNRRICYRLIGPRFRMRGGAEHIGKDLLDGFGNPARWLTYSGDYTGQRHSPLTEITAANAAHLVAPVDLPDRRGHGKFEATPIVIDGVIYITGPLDHVWAIDGADRPPALALPTPRAERCPGLLRDGEPRLRRLSATASSWTRSMRISSR